MSGVILIAIALAASYPSAASTTPVSGSAMPGTEIIRHWERVDRFDDPRMLWVGLAIAGAAALLFVIWLYRRESAGLPRYAAVGLALLRIIALIGIGLFYLNPSRRADREVVAQSRVDVLVDISQSMAVADESTTGKKGVARLMAVVESLKTSPLLSELRREHDVTLTAFDAKSNQLVKWKRGEKHAEKQGVESEENNATTAANPALNELPIEPVPSPRSHWTDGLSALGVETRIGDALASSLAESGGPLAGVIVISDGEQTSGLDVLSQADLAAAAKTPVVTIGVGSTEPRRNVRVQELLAPPRAYPKDKVVVRALVQGEQFKDRTVDVELFSRQGNESQAAAIRVGKESARFDEDRQVVPVEFEIEPAVAGRLELEARIVAPPDDQYSEDNRRIADIDVVESSTKVLLLASGPTRDYRFLRNQLRRDDHATVDVLLQKSLPGISQDSDMILTDFPSTKDEMFQYDCLVAFDPEWTELDADQIALLEEWVDKEAGGMIVVAGPVHGGDWLQSPEHAKIRSLYPVEFQERLALLDDGLYGSKTPWPLDFTRQGTEADFLWLGDTPEESRANWSRFPGVYGCYRTKGPKTGATVYAFYGDPDAQITVGKPVYFADQFYGSGRVFYMGSGELWRLRAVDPGFFEKLTTQLIRHVSEGRLLRGSSRGRLLAERDRYFVGDVVLLRAQLSGADREPFVASQVVAQLTMPDGSTQNFPLVADSARPGNFVGQFIAHAEGSYRIDLSPPDAPDEVLTKRIAAAAPDLEFNDTRRNEPLLAAIAKRSGGRYYETLDEAVAGSSDAPSVAKMLPSRSETKTLRGKPDKAYAERVHKALLAVICGALCLEWLGRRLLRLA